MNWNVVVIPERRWPRPYAWMDSETSIECQPTQSWAAMARHIVDVSSYTGFPPAGTITATELSRFASPIRYRVARPFHVGYVSVTPAAGSLSVTGYAPIIYVAGSSATAGRTGVPVEAPLQVSMEESAPSHEAAQTRARALAILQSWLEPHESDDQVAAFRQLKEDLKESRRGQRRLFPD